MNINSYKYYICAFRRKGEEDYKIVYSSDNITDCKAWARRVVLTIPEGAAKVYRRGPASSIRRDDKTGEEYLTGLIAVFAAEHDAAGMYRERG